ncbi:MAG TPA: translation initiation factor IF-5A [Candidatus Altiarchaeales archaeon]|nr:translation initiation factor IF-5A [Candidatus Altiarchaeales archaeon]
MEKRIGTMKDLKEGKYVVIDNEPCRVVKVVHSKPGKHGGAKARIDAIGLFDGQKRTLMGPVSQNVEIPIINKRTAQVLNIIQDKANLMDMETYETFELPIPDELKDKLTDGKEILYMESMGKRKILQLQ